MTLLSLATVALTCTVPAALEQVEPIPEWGKPVNGVRARIFSVQDGYEPGEDLQFVLMFQNISSKSLPWPGCDLFPCVLPKGGRSPEVLDRTNLRLDLDHDVKEHEQLLVDRVKKLQQLDRLAPNDIRVVVITVSQPGRRVEEQKKLARLGEPQRETADLVVRLKPGEYRFRVTYSPMGFPLPEGAEKERLDESDEMARLWDGKSIPVPPVTVTIAEK